MSVQINRYWKPYFGKEKKLNEVRRSDLREFTLWLAKKGLAPKSRNNTLQAGTVALRWAFHDERIPSNPAEGLRKFSGKTEKRGILSAEEVKTLFSVTWSDKRARAGNVLAMTTGLRAGEVLAVQVQDIGPDRLYVRHSWSNQDALKSTETGEARYVPLILSVRSALLELAESNPQGTAPHSFVFWSVSMADRPMDFHFLLDDLKSALLRVSLSEEQLKDGDKVETARRYWKERNIVFHSWRHFYAANLANRVEKRKAMIATGHKTGTVFDAYADHENAEFFTEVREALSESFESLTGGTA